MSRRSQRAGRRDNTERIRDLVALLGSLSRTGDTVSVDAISARLGVSAEEAHALMDIVCQASGEESVGLLISCNDDETEYTLQFPGITGKPVRLTEAESIAVHHALDLAGMSEDDALRKKLNDALVSTDVQIADVRHALGEGVPNAVLALCAQAQVEGKTLDFSYQGMRDACPRRRRVAVRQLVPGDDTWYVKALDLSLNQERTFRVDRMSDVSLGLDTPSQQGAPATQKRLVNATFNRRTYFDYFDWPGLTVLEDNGDVIRCSIVYYGPQSGWLERRIAACDGTFVVDDERIMSSARAYARSQLAYYRS